MLQRLLPPNNKTLPHTAWGFTVKATSLWPVCAMESSHTPQERAFLEAFLESKCSFFLHLSDLSLSQPLSELEWEGNAKEEKERDNGWAERVKGGKEWLILKHMKQLLSPSFCFQFLLNYWLVPSRWLLGTCHKSLMTWAWSPSTVEGENSCPLTSTYTHIYCDMCTNAYTYTCAHTPHIHKDIKRNKVIKYLLCSQIYPNSVY